MRANARRDIFRSLMRSDARAQGGFSLTEALVTLAIVGLITAVMATGVAFASKQYTNTVQLSEAKVLHSTLKAVIANELENTSHIEVQGTDASVARPVVRFSGQYYGEVASYVSFHIVSGTDIGDGYGQLALGGEDPDTWQRLANSNTYPHGSGAKVNVKYHKEVPAQNVGLANETPRIPGHFHVSLSVKTESGVVVEDSFDVNPLNPEESILSEDSTTPAGGDEGGGSGGTISAGGDEGGGTSSGESGSGSSGATPVDPSGVVEGNTLELTVGGSTHSIDIEDYNNEGDLKAGTVYRKDDVLYFANKNYDDPYHTDLVELSGWNYNDSGVAKLVFTFLTTDMFTAEGNTKYPGYQEKGTLYYDESTGKLWASNWTGQWIGLPSVQASSWNDVSGLLAS